jgi:hypothetical protein
MCLGQENIMKKLGLIMLALVILAFGCQQKRNQENDIISDSLANDGIEIQEKTDKASSTDSSGKKKEFERFDVIFEHENKEHHFRQRLGITWLTNDSIEFRLLSEDDLCGTDYWGNAKNQYADMDPESDEDENGESYSASEYVEEEQSYSLRIRISLDKDRARIIYTDKSGQETDCIPTPNLILVNKDAR